MCVCASLCMDVYIYIHSCFIPTEKFRVSIFILDCNQNRTLEATKYYIPISVIYMKILNTNCFKLTHKANLKINLAMLLSCFLR